MVREMNVESTHLIETDLFKNKKGFLNRNMQWKEFSF